MAHCPNVAPPAVCTDESCVYCRIAREEGVLRDTQQAARAQEIAPQAGDPQPSR